MLNVYLVSLRLINERFIYLILITMKKQVLKSRFINPPLQSRGFTIGAVYYRSLTLSFCFLFLSMVCVHDVFGQYTYSTPGTYLIDDNGNICIDKIIKY